MSRRIAATLDFSPVLAAMTREGLDALVAMEPHTVALLLNHWDELHTVMAFKEFPECAVILSSGDVIALNPLRKGHAPWVKEYIGDGWYTPEHDSTLELLKKTLYREGLQNASIGFELECIPVSMMQWITAELPGIGVQDGEWILWQLRAVKSEKQLGFINKAVSACEAGVKDMWSNWKEGESVHKILDGFEQVLKLHGARNFSTYQQAFAKEWFPFSGRDQILSEDFILEANDDVEVNFDMIVRYQAYFSDWKRSFYLGSPPKKMADVYEFEWRVVDTLTTAVKPGMSIPEAQEACDAILENEGLTNWWCVHSVGLQIHEEPIIGSIEPITSETGEVKTGRFPGLMRGRNKQMTFEPNMVLMVETILVEDPYLMTPKGLRRLNKLPQELFVVPA